MLNKIMLIGNVGQDPELKELSKDNHVVNLSIATSESYKNKEGEKITNTEWHRCVAYGKPAEIIAKYVKKGSKLFVEGSVHTRSWEDKDGTTKYSTEVKIRDFRFLGGNEDSASAPSKAKPKKEAFEPEDDDLPW